VPPAGAYVGILHSNSPPPPIKLFYYAGADAGAHAFFDIAVDFQLFVVTFNIILVVVSETLNHIVQ